MTIDTGIVLPDPYETPTLSPARVAKILGKGREAVVGLCDSGELRTLRPGRHRRILTSALYTYLELPLPRDPWTREQLDNAPPMSESQREKLGRILADAPISE